MNAKGKFISILSSLKLDGTDRLIMNLERSGFFDSPASTKFHGNYPGGLLDHSLNVLDTLSAFELPIPRRSVVIAALLHDVCKIGLYCGGPGHYTFNPKMSDSGHALRSLKILELFLELSPLEIKMIRYHMGMYYCKEHHSRGEYPLSELIEAFKTPAVKFLHISDEIAANHTEKKEVIHE